MLRRRRSPRSRSGRSFVVWQTPVGGWWKGEGLQSLLGTDGTSGVPVGTGLYGDGETTGRNVRQSAAGLHGRNHDRRELLQVYTSNRARSSPTMVSSPSGTLPRRSDVDRRRHDLLLTRPFLRVTLHPRALQRRIYSWIEEEPRPPGSRRSTSS